jgi:hypothetical protein
MANRHVNINYPQHMAAVATLLLGQSNRKEGDRKRLEMGL